MNAAFRCRPGTRYQQGGLPSYGWYWSPWLYAWQPAPVQVTQSRIPQAGLLKVDTQGQRTQVMVEAAIEPWPLNVGPVTCEPWVTEKGRGRDAAEVPPGVTARGRLCYRFPAAVAYKGQDGHGVSALESCVSRGLGSHMRNPAHVAGCPMSHSGEASQMWGCTARTVARTQRATVRYAAGCLHTRPRWHSGSPASCRP